MLVMLEQENAVRSDVSNDFKFYVVMRVKFMILNARLYDFTWSVFFF